ncbi:uncharacterized protein F4807DRAFT_16592 [Annulohypoxylon truncatum]|uniref:uncharacterized protein n=1 Tax=Annulohypoxylon truncatum TaxID=327061 RepID=UPI0020075BB8|nr:uncharacterized protein F4807DRAFT_16592 [Annulohypoxylon truncatum]KAI1214990.1 hypothetical protein F4807DRAFT_16592 [Annulohypoxylon truncatum]
MAGLWQEDDYGIIAKKGCWSMVSILTVVIGMRVYCRLSFGRNAIGADDWIVVLCLIVAYVDCIFTTIGIGYGLGKHYKVLDPADAVEALRWSVIASTVNVWVFSLPKFAIVAILKRILDFKTKTAILFWGLCLTSQACIFATSVWWVHQCSPVEYGWDKSIQGKCAPVSVIQNLGYATTAYSAFLDMFFALYPVPFIMKLNMPLKSRIAISAAMSLSVTASAVSIYKLAIFKQVFDVLAKDPTYPTPYFFMLGFAEGFVLILGSSCPTLGPLFRAVKRTISTSLSSKGDTSNSNLGQSGPQYSDPGRKWKNLRGHRLTDHQATLASIDAIPLYPTTTVTNKDDDHIPDTVDTH